LLAAALGGNMRFIPSAADARAGLLAAAWGVPHTALRPWMG
jgi:hypothetical protein